MTHQLIRPALKLCEALQQQSEQKLAPELFAIVTEIDGVDYIMTMMRLPSSASA